MQFKRASWPRQLSIEDLEAATGGRTPLEPDSNPEKPTQSSSAPLSDN